MIELLIAISIGLFFLFGFEIISIRSELRRLNKRIGVCFNIIGNLPDQVEFTELKQEVEQLKKK